MFKGLDIIENIFYQVIYRVSQLILVKDSTVHTKNWYIQFSLSKFFNAFEMLKTEHIVKYQITSNISKIWILLIV